MRDPMSFGVGEVLFSPAFTVSPAQVWAWQRAWVLDRRDDGPDFRPSLERPVDGSRAPEGLVVARTLDAIGQSHSLGGCLLRQTSTPQVHLTTPVAVGEPLTAVATVRYRSAQRGRTFITLAIELRSPVRKHGVIEVCVEVEATGDDFTWSTPARAA